MSSPIASGVGASTVDTVPVDDGGSKEVTLLRHEPTNILYFLLGCLLPLRSLPVVGDIAGGLPINTITAAIIAAIAFCLRPAWPTRARLFSTLVMLLVGWLIFGTVIIHGDTDVRRAGNILVLLAAGWMIAGGRLHLPSLARGVVAGLLGSTVLGILSIGSSSYVGRMTSLMGDPNASGFVLLSLGLASAQWFRRRWVRLATLLLITVGILATVSRTSMFALAIATLWVAFGYRLSKFLAAGLLAGVVWAYFWLVDIAEQRGWFQDRDGSDALRERLLVVEAVMVDTAGWVGHGLGTAVAEFDNITLYFHNSFLSLAAEGGRVALLLFIGATAALYLANYSVPTERRARWSEAAIIAAIICSFNIGFSVTHPAFAVALGLHLAALSKARQETGGSLVGREHWWSGKQGLGETPIRV